MIDSWLPFLGRFHPVLVHLPIGFLVAIALLAVAGRGRGEAWNRALLLLLGVGSAVSIASVLTGLQLAREGGYPAQLLERHKWLSIGMTAGVTLAWGCKLLQGWRGSRAWGAAYAGCLGLSLVLMLTGAHYGGSMTHGRDYLTQHWPLREPAPAENRRQLAAASSALAPEEAALGQAEAPLLEEDAPGPGLGSAFDEEGEAVEGEDVPELVSFEASVQPILQAKCYDCHGPDKMKGELRLDTPDFILLGGENGQVLQAGKPEDSSLYYMTTYPEDDPDFMPQKGEGLSEAEKAILRLWIEQGAVFGAEPVAAAAPVVADPPSRAIALEPAELTDWQRLNGLIEQLREQGVLVDATLEGEGVELKYTYVRGEGSLNLENVGDLRAYVASLDFSRTPVETADLKGLERFPRLERLNLSRTRLGDAALELLDGQGQLTHLNLSGTQVTDRGLSSLASLRGLRSLYLFDCSVTEEAVRRLEGSIPGLRVVR